ncbi:hypothetical protein [Bartonella senegalensis]|uniref:hypothetical protein n=1 Tax=Bartonella senegalensis TaxID=1468418 RepID=UPI000565B9D2|nr:hypothetical protein [Bartonella senegalensis]
MESSRHRVVIVVISFLIFVAVLFVYWKPSVSHVLFNRSLSSHQDSVTEKVLLERLEISFPGIITKLSKLKPQQQKQLIEQVRRDIVAAAAASGQSNEQARKLGDTAAMVLSKAASRAAVADAYF